MPEAAAPTAPSMATNPSPTAAANPPVRRRRSPPRRVEVVRTALLTPHLRRITFGGEALAGWQPGAPSGHIKVFLPAAGDEEVHLPTYTDDGPVYDESLPRPTIRTYTPRHFRPATDGTEAELDVDFVLHDAGPASRWAAAARPGDRAAIAGPGRGYEPDPAAAWFVIAGDEAALPAIGAIVEALPSASTAHVVVEIADAGDQIPLTAEATVQATWLARGEAAAGALLEAHLAQMAVPEGPGRWWVATEAAVVRRIRADLIKRRGVATTDLVTRGYWKAGLPNHSDHDYAED